MDVRAWLDAKLTGPGHQYDGHATNGSIKAQIDAIAPTITKLVEAARNFAARVEERNPEWFREERGTTDFSEADHALRAALAELEKP